MCCLLMTLSTENATSPKSNKSRNLDSSVSRSTNPNWDFGLISICIGEIDFREFVDSGGISVESVVHFQWNLSTDVTDHVMWSLSCDRSCHVTWQWRHTTDSIWHDLSHQIPLSHNRFHWKSRHVTWLSLEWIFWLCADLVDWVIKRRKTHADWVRSRGKTLTYVTWRIT